MLRPRPLAPAPCLFAQSSSHLALPCPAPPRQIVSAKLQGDVVLAAAYSHELPRYGIKHGLTNWAACYATGLLVARRALTKLGLADKYEGVTEPSGELELTEAIEGEPRPFKCFLDVGLARTSTGARVFGAMKGASDGGVFIPHSEGRFPGFDPESKELDAEVLQSYIYGGHVAEFMEVRPASLSSIPALPNLVVVERELSAAAGPSPPRPPLPPLAPSKLAARRSRCAHRAHRVLFATVARGRG